jgi:hypothetical protein
MVSDNVGVPYKQRITAALGASGLPYLGRDAGQACAAASQCAEIAPHRIGAAEPER